MRRLLKPLWILLALVFLFEAWLWEHLRPLVAWVVERIVRWDRLKARLAAAIEHLPPYPTLLVFLVPVVLLFPLKLLGLWMLAHGSWLGAMAVLALAKVVSMGVTAFIFELTRPKLLQLPWFRWFYEHMLVWLAKAHALIDPIKARRQTAHAHAVLADEARPLGPLLPPPRAHPPPHAGAAGGVDVPRIQCAAPSRFENMASKKCATSCGKVGSTKPVVVNRTPISPTPIAAQRAR